MKHKPWVTNLCYNNRDLYVCIYEFICDFHIWILIYEYLHKWINLYMIYILFIIYILNTQLNLYIYMCIWMIICVNMDRKQDIHFKRKEIQRREQVFKVNKILKFSNSKFELDSVRT